MSASTIRPQISANEFQDIELESVTYPLPTQDATQRKAVSQQSDTATGIGSENGHNNDEPAGVTSPQSLTNTDHSGISAWRATVIIGTVASIIIMSDMLAGILVVSLPTMARDVGLADDLLLWPASVSSLACGCTLLISGSIADVAGGRKIYLIGALLLTVTTVACGLSQTGIQLILFRAASGVALSLCLPSALMLITSNIPTGSYRNTAFACLGAAQPVGFSVGLVLGGVFVESSNWRFGYYIGAGLIFLTWGASFYALPTDPVTEVQSFRTTLTRLRTEIDWIGCMLISTSLGMFSYVFSVLSGGASSFLAPASLTLFSIAVVLIPTFGFYVRRQERLRRKVIIPPSIWANRVFTSLCITIFVVWGVFSAVQYFLTLFFQEVQRLSPLQTSIRFLPMVITGATTNFLTGWLVKRVRADILVLSTATVGAVAPLLMALVNPDWSYWMCAFFATCLTPICADTLFTISNLVITSVFPPQTHGLAGGVFNTVSSIGNSIGLAITAVVASAVTMSKQHSDETATQRLMDGYRATFWLCFAANVAVLAFVAFGLRKIGKVGIKVE